MSVFKFSLNEFDSEVFEYTVYNCEVDHYFEGLSSLQKAVPSDAELISLQSAHEIPELEDHFVGAMVNLAGSFEQYSKALKKVPLKFSVQSLEDPDWLGVRDLFKQASSTRYISDKNLNAEKVLDHKLKILQTYHNAESINSFKLVHSDNLKGFHQYTWNPKKGVYRPYEIVLERELRMGIPALNLLAFAADNFESMYSVKDAKVETGIYKDNTISLKMFESLGLKKMREIYYYHYWRNKV